MAKIKLTGVRNLARAHWPMLHVGPVEICSGLVKCSITSIIDYGIYIYMEVVRLVDSKVSSHTY